MSDQDAQDINQMMSSTSEVPIAAPKKSKFIWVVLGCMVLGVGLGVVVYKQSIAPPATTTKSTPKPTAKPSVAATPTPTPSNLVPTIPQTNVVTPMANTVTFPKAGKIRVFNDLNNIQMLLVLNLSGQTKNLTIVNKTTSESVPMNYGDSTFEVAAGSSATFEAYLNNTSGPKMKGWIAPFDAQKKECGIAGGNTNNNESKLAYVQTLIGTEPIYSYQCWEDNDSPGEYNDIYLLWTYVPVTTTVSPSPAASTTASLSPSPSPSPSLSPSPSPSRSASPSPSPSASVRASAAASTAATASPSPTVSPRVSMPDTSDGTPVTGVFEVTVGTISVGIVFLILGLFGLLVL